MKCVTRKVKRMSMTSDSVYANLSLQDNHEIFQRFNREDNTAFFISLNKTIFSVKIEKIFHDGSDYVFVFSILKPDKYRCYTVGSRFLNMELWKTLEKASEILTWCTDFFKEISHVPSAKMSYQVCACGFKPYCLALMECRDMAFSVVGIEVVNVVWNETLEKEEIKMVVRDMYGMIFEPMDHVPFFDHQKNIVVFQKKMIPFL